MADRSEWGKFSRLGAGALFAERIAIENDYESAQDLVSQAQHLVQIVHVEDKHLRGETKNHLTWFFESHGLVYVYFRVPGCDNDHVAIGRYEDFPEHYKDATEFIVSKLLHKF